MVYLDICCLKRPFDDQRSTRVQIETAAVAAIIEQAQRGDVQLVRQFVELGFSSLDALHTAFAEAAGAAWLATTDDRLIALGRQHRTTLAVRIADPTTLIENLTRGEP